METDFSNPVLKARYLNNGSGKLKTNIKRLKSNNKSKLNDTHLLFFKKFKLKKEEDDRDRIHENMNLFKGIGGISGLDVLEKRAMTVESNYNRTFYNDTARGMHEKGNPNEKLFRGTNHSNLFTWNNKPNEMNNQINALDNITTPNNKNNKNIFLKTNYTNFTTASNITNTQPLMTEEEAVNLVSFYHMNKNDKIENTLNKIYISKEDKQNLLERFNIKKTKNEKEKEAIELFLKRKDKKKNNYERTMEKFNKTEYNSHPNFFNDPHKSLKKLKLNGQIFQNIMNMRTNEQEMQYDNIYNRELENWLKLSLMPKVRELKGNKTINDKLIQKTNEMNMNNKKTKSSNLLNDENLDLSLKNETNKTKTLSNIPKLPIADKQLSREQLLEKLEFHANIEPIKYKPVSRSQFTLNLNGNNLVLFGGISSERMFEVWICNIKDHFTWKQIEMDEDEGPVPRSGHTAIVYRKEIYIYGGSTPREYFKPREDILVFSMLTNQFYSEKTLNRAEAGWRRNHIALILGNCMFVHGGIDESERFLSDCLILDITKMTWSKLEFKGVKPSALAFHCAELVMEADKKNHPGFNIYKSPDIPTNKNVVKKIKYEGIYIFGGMDENRNCTNELRILKVGRKPTEWFYPRIHGSPPAPRINATINYYSELNILLIHGGRNDKERKNIFNDIYVMDLENLIWIRAEFNNFTPFDRTEHCAVVFEDTLLILGGNDATKFNNFDFCVVHLDLYNKRKNGAKNFHNEHLREEKSQIKKEKINETQGRNFPIINFNNSNISKDVIPLIESKKLAEIIRLTSNSDENVLSENL